MRDSSYKILRTLRSEGDMPLENIAKLLPRSFKDHRDFYPLASLISQGLVEDSFAAHLANSSTTQERWEKTQLIAWRLFAMHDADKSASYQGQTWTLAGGTETLRGQRYALTGNGYLHLQERQVRRNDRVFATMLAIASAVAAAYLTAHFSAPAAGI